MEEIRFGRGLEDGFEEVWKGFGRYLERIWKRLAKRLGRGVTNVWEEVWKWFGNDMEEV